MMTQSFRGELTDVPSVFRFMFAGKAIMTLVSMNSGDHFTYKIREGKKNEKYPRPLYNVLVLNGPDNTSNYAYIGYIKSNNEFVHGGEKACAGKDAPSVKAFTFAMEYFNAHKRIPTTMKVWHEDRCGRCGRKLSHQDSIATGFGPECSDVVGVARVHVAPAPKPVKSVVPQRAVAVQPTIRTAQAKPTPSPAAIRAMINRMKAENPEGYYMDGELNEKQAFEFWSKRFAIQPYEGIKGVA